MRRADYRPPVKEIWWINPWKALLFLVIPFYILMYYTPTLFGVYAVNLRFKVLWDTDMFLLGLAYLLIAANACLIMSYVRVVRRDPFARQGSIKDGYLDFLALATIAAYALWFRGYIMKPWLLVNLFIGGEGISRAAHRTVPGVTTLTQFGIAYVIFYGDRVWGAAKGTVHRRFHWYFAAILFCAVFRVYVWAERLALIEIAVPAAVVYLYHRRERLRGIMRLIAMLGPAIGVVALIAYFGLTEYFRSWSYYQQTTNQDFSDFAGKRLLTYYYTALNNGAGALVVLEWPRYTLEHVLAWLYRLPLIIGAIFRSVVQPEPLDHLFLARYADLEFNNMSGIYPVFYDLGIIGGLLYAALWGGLIGYLYSGFKQRVGIGRVLFPIVYISILETLRLLYLSESRAFPALLAVVMGYLLFREKTADPARQQSTDAPVTLQKAVPHT